MLKKEIGEESTKVTNHHQFRKQQLPAQAPGLILAILGPVTTTIGLTMTTIGRMTIVQIPQILGVVILEAVVLEEIGKIMVRWRNGRRLFRKPNEVANVRNR